MLDVFSDLKIFLQDPQPWSNMGKQVDSILPRCTSRQCKQTLFTVDPQSPQVFYPPNSNQEKTYRLNEERQSDRIYRSVIECDDAYPLAYQDVWPNTPVWIYSTVRMMVVCSKKKPIKVLHTPVPGSFLFHPDDGNEEALNDSIWDNNTQKIKHTQSGFISYCPVLCMIVQKLTLCSKEWESAATWKLELLEQEFKD